VDVLKKKNRFIISGLWKSLKKVGAKACNLKRFFSLWKQFRKWTDGDASTINSMCLPFFNTIYSRVRFEDEKFKLQKFYEKGRVKNGK